ncbi:hypothetical protein [Flaviaesturariibacter amylovorans]|uniref:hypothetical protein n=1 Tax=Flaviaesturariibacter amylovorans TaxID=1084520 RepID=UPI0031E9DFB5
MATDEKGTGSTAATSFGGFRAARVPYSLSDTALLRHSDTTALDADRFTGYLPDSLRSALFGSARIRYSPLARIGGEEGSETYYVVKAAAGARQAALLFVFDKQQALGGAFPFLAPDSDPSTAQTSGIDKSYSIVRSVVRKKTNETSSDGKDVFIYNAAAKTFTLISTDPLEDRRDVLNPIDTMKRTHPLAGDYVRNERNFISVRDARSPSEISFFVHFEKDEDCSGELNGTALLTSSRTAVYRQGGDPCVLELTFSANSVSMREMEGCGSHRGVQCLFEGKFPRKKEVSPKSTPKKKGKK